MVFLINAMAFLKLFLNVTSLSLTSVAGCFVFVGLVKKTLKIIIFSILQPIDSN